MAEKDEMDLRQDNPGRAWYVIHTYSGYENKVKANLERLIHTANMGNMIFNVVVPVEDEVEIKDGKKVRVCKHCGFYKGVQVVAVNDEVMVKIIDIDLERRRISLSLKQANEDYTEEFDPSKYGMADSYDEQGNYIFPEGFDADSNEWLEGFEKQRDEWEARYAEAERRHKMHTAQMEKFAAADR